VTSTTASRQLERCVCLLQANGLTSAAVREMFDSRAVSGASQEAFAALLSTHVRVARDGLCSVRTRGDHEAVAVMRLINGARRLLFANTVDDGLDELCFRIVAQVAAGRPGTTDDFPPG
jgi:hypothetical protein